ncbi:hypothetical protein Pfo_004198 [Paulownia fortunei]|nr:hypothetical protein Pfo_004198 [Paulownia fortunei]
MALKIEQLHFLLVPLMSQSHIIPLTDFAKLVARRGVFVSIVTTPLNAIRYKGVIDNSKAQNLKIQMIPIEFPCQEAGLPDGYDEGPLEKLIQELEPKPNCIISTSAIPWTQKVAEKFKIPRYNFETVSCFTLLCSHNLSQADVQESVVSDSEPFMVPDIPHKIEFTKAQLPKTMTKGLDGFKEIIDQIKQARDSAQGTVVNSFEELEPWYLEGCKKERGKVWCIGPVSLCNKELSERSSRGNKAAIDEHYCLTWLDSMKPKSVIYACFGSLCRISIPQIKEIGLAEVENWLAEERFDERVRGRGLVIRGWAPQVLILSHPSVGGFLTHCGWNSTLEGVCAGVPMITWPMFAEQFYNEKFIVNVLGIGVRVGVEGCMNSEQSGDLVKWDQVKNAIENLMDESEDGIKRRKRAEELAKMAINAVEKGGSSYLNVTRLIQDVTKQVQ